ncbi:MAG: hypothetical protein KGL51_10010 [Betaproteobacteria bacterium]|nr:hypothetical protein [Betaproteobacteria bacterium]MDE2324986.1 hypothetical protein [Betaproteobacteria bacterium]
MTPRWMGAGAAAATASTQAEGGEALVETAHADMMQRLILAERRFEHELAALERLILVPVPTRP